MIKKILLVEYAPASIESIRDALAAPIFDITTAAEGEAAKKILKKQVFDLVITAAMLPKFHGFNLSQHVAETYPGTKIIVISGIYKGAENRKKAIDKFNADEFFEKPIDGDRFRKKVLKLLNVSEKDMKNERVMATMKSPAVDTTKVPIVKRKKGDRQDDVRTGDISADDRPLLDILNEEAVKHLNATEEPAGEDELKTVKQVEESGQPAQTNVPPSVKTTVVRADTEEFKRPSLATQKFDIDFESLKKPGKKGKNKKKFKKIEDEINKKFEDTLSGLGLSNKQQAAGSATQKIDIKPGQTAHEQVEKFNRATPEEQFKTVRIDRPFIEPKEEKVGDYEILGLIARGGMAEIYKAKKKGVKGFEKIIALKKILSGYVEDDKYIEMFVDEAKIAAELTHPNIVQIYDLGQKDDFYFIAMEYVLGRDLRLVLRRLSELKKSFPEELSLHLILKVLSALNYAHSAKDSKGKRLEIVHRDISPPNILMSFDGNIKLTDFGVSKATNKMHQTISGALKGKLLYMSPEQARSESDIDYRSDLYSAGIILFELITGQKLFMDSSDLLVLKKVQHGEIIKPSTVKPDIDAELERIILKSLAKDKEQRYADASEMMKDIETYLMNAYDRLPGPIHVSHFLHDIFKKEIAKENIDIDLKEIPYTVKRLARQQPPAPPVQEEDEISLPLKEANDSYEDLSPPEEGEFAPIIEIDLDRVREDEPVPVGKTGPPAEKRPGYLGIEGLKPPKEDKTKKYLIWIIILVAVGIAVSIFIINYLSSAEDDPRAHLNAPVEQAGVPTPGLTGTGEAVAELKEGTGDAVDETKAAAGDETAVKDDATVEQPGRDDSARPSGTPGAGQDDSPARRTEQTQKEAAANPKTPVKDVSKKVPETKPPINKVDKEPVEEKPGVKKESEKETGTGMEKKPGTVETPATAKPVSRAVVAGQLFPASDIDIQPEPISTPSPKLSRSLRRNLPGDQAVLVSFLIDHRGKVETVKLLRGTKNKKVNEIIKNTIKKWTYKPALKENVRVKVWQTRTVTIRK